MVRIPLGGFLALLLLVAAPGPARGNGEGVEGPAAQTSAPAPAPASCGERLARRVQQRYETIRDLSARFEQRTDRVALGSGPAGTLVARGEVVFAKPGRMRWSYEEPEASLVVSDGKSVWIYDPQAREAQRLPLGERFLSGAAIQFLLGRGDLLEEFEVDVARCDESPVRLLLAPRRDAPFERLEVRADPATGEVLATTVVDLLGNATHVTFQKVRTNLDPSGALFRFEPPEGVRVLELPGAEPGAEGGP